MSSVPPAGGDGKARRDEALALLRVRRADLIRECTAAALRVALECGSTRPAAHARPLSLWQLADAEGAATRLAALRTP